MIMTAPSYVSTIGCVAKILGEDEDRLHELALEMKPEDGCLWLHETDNQDTKASTDRGVEYLRQLVADRKNQRQKIRCRTIPWPSPAFNYPQVQALAENGIVCSMNRSGNVWDNAAMESFFSSLKTERIRGKVYRTRSATLAPSSTKTGGVSLTDCPADWQQLAAIVISIIWRAPTLGDNLTLAFAK